jgi:uncharacterized membrane protein
MKKIIIIFLILLLDLIRLYLNQDNFKNLIKDVQCSPIRINIIGAILSYLTIIIGILYFSIPLIKIKKKKSNLLLLCLIYGGGLGFIMYGIANFTNIAIFKNYDIYTALSNILWGMFLFTFITYQYNIL